MSKSLTLLKGACVKECTQGPNDAVSPTRDVVEGLCVLPVSKKHLNLTHLARLKQRILYGDIQGGDFLYIHKCYV